MEIKTNVHIEALHEGDYWRDWQGHEFSCIINDPNRSFPYHYLRASINDQHVGWVRYQKTESETYIFDVYVVEWARKQGVAGALLRAAVAGREDRLLSGHWQEHRLRSFAEKHNSLV